MDLSFFCGKWAYVKSKNLFRIRIVTWWKQLQIQINTHINRKHSYTDMANFFRSRCGMSHWIVYGKILLPLVFFIPYNYFNIGLEKYPAFQLDLFIRYYGVPHTGFILTFFWLWIRNFSCLKTMPQFFSHKKIGSGFITLLLKNNRWLIFTWKYAWTRCSITIQSFPPLKHTDTAPTTYFWMNKENSWKFQNNVWKTTKTICLTGLVFGKTLFYSLQGIFNCMSEHRVFRFLYRKEIFRI